MRDFWWKGIHSVADYYYYSYTLLRKPNRYIKILNHIMQPFSLNLHMNISPLCLCSSLPTSESIKIDEL